MKFYDNMKALVLLAGILSVTSMAMAQEPQKQPDVYEQAEAEADRLQQILDLEDWQVFYVDSTLKHDLPAMMAEYDKLRAAKVSNTSMYQAVQDKWMEQVDATYKRIFSPQQWAAYLKSGAAKAQKARDKRKAQAEGKKKRKITIEMDFLEVVEKRRSVRKYSDKAVERELLDAIVKVAQTAPSSRNSKSSAFMIIEERDILDALSQMRDYGSSLLSGAQAAIVVLGDESKTDLWVDNCAISATFVQLAVTAMDLVSCWVHCNGRPRYKVEPDGPQAEDYVRELLGIKEGLRPYCVIAIGYPQEEN